MTRFFEKLSSLLLTLVLFSTVPLSNSRLGQKNLPKCKHDEDVVKSDKLIPYLLNADYIFTGKVASGAQIFGDRVKFDVSVQKCFKDSGVLVNQSVVKVVKQLRDGEGTTCRSVVRKKLTAIFVGTADGSFLGDVNLSISPVPVTLASLDRVSSVVRGHKCHHNESKRAAYGSEYFFINSS